MTSAFAHSGYLGVLLFAVPIATTAVGVLARVIVRWRASTIALRVVERALQNCPPNRRADVVASVAELADSLIADDRVTRVHCALAFTPIPVGPLHQPRARHSGSDARSAPSVESLP